MADVPFRESRFADSLGVSKVEFWLDLGVAVSPQADLLQYELCCLMIVQVLCSPLLEQFLRFGRFGRFQLIGSAFCELRA
jgi:hypothetical protein